MHVTLHTATKFLINLTPGKKDSILLFTILNSSDIMINESSQLLHMCYHFLVKINCTVWPLLQHFHFHNYVSFVTEFVLNWEYPDLSTFLKNVYNKFYTHDVMC